MRLNKCFMILSLLNLIVIAILAIGMLRLSIGIVIAGLALFVVQTTVGAVYLSRRAYEWWVWTTATTVWIQTLTIAFGVAPVIAVSCLIENYEHLDSMIPGALVAAVVFGLYLIAVVNLYGFTDEILNPPQPTQQNHHVYHDDYMDQMISIQQELDKPKWR